jgi:hypothetical protein
MSKDNPLPYVYIADKKYYNETGNIKIFTKVVGVTFSNNKGIDRQSILRGMRHMSDVKLQPEPYNPYDKNAVGVYYKGQNVGYVAKDIAPLLLPYIKNYSQDVIAVKTESPTGAIGLDLAITFQHYIQADPSSPFTFEEMMSMEKERYLNSVNQTYENNYRENNSVNKNDFKRIKIIEFVAGLHFVLPKHNITINSLPDEIMVGRLVKQLVLSNDTFMVISCFPPSDLEFLFISSYKRCTKEITNNLINTMTIISGGFGVDSSFKPNVALLNFTKRKLYRCSTFNTCMVEDEKKKLFIYMYPKYYDGKYPVGISTEYP